MDQEPHVRTQFGEKFWAFAILVLAVLSIVGIANAYPPEKDSVVRLMDAANGGLLLALGAAANALFRVSQKDTEEAAAARLNAETLGKLADKAPPPTGEARESLQEQEGVVDFSTGTVQPPAEPLPPMFREEELKP